MSKVSFYTTLLITAVSVSSCMQKKPTNSQEVANQKPIEIVAGAFTGRNDQLSIVTAEGDTLALAAGVDTAYVAPSQRTAANTFKAFINEGPANDTTHKNDALRVELGSGKVYQHGKMSEKAREVTGYVNTKYDHKGIKFTRVPE